jgi:hypothetical protein
MSGQSSEGSSRLPGEFEDSDRADRDPTPQPRSPPPSTPGDTGGEVVRLRAKMADSVVTSAGSLHLPSSMELKGEENYAVWKEAMMNLAISNGLKRYLRTDPRKPIEVDEFDPKVSDTAVKAWQDWEAGDAKTKLALSYNLTSVPVQVIQGKKTALECWQALELNYEVKGNVLKYNAIMHFINIKYEDFSSLDNFIIGFRKSLEKLTTLQTAPPDEWGPWVFIGCVADAFPIWAERQRSVNRNDEKPPSLDSLIADIVDENRSKNANQKPSDSQALYNKDNKGKGAGGSGQQANGGKDKNKKDKKCKHCKQPNPRHSESDCMEINLEKRKAWEEKTSKKWVPYSEYSKKKEDSKKKTPAPDKSDDGKDTTFGFAAFTTGSTAFLSLNQDRWLADSGANGHVANNRARFDTFKEIPMGPVDTAGGPVIPVGIGTVKLYLPKSNGGRTELTLYDVIYMPQCPINLFSLHKLNKLGGYLKGDKIIFLQDGKKEAELCQVDEDLFLIEEDQFRQALVKKDLQQPAAFPAKTDDEKKPKPLDIDLTVHRRRGAALHPIYLGGGRIGR